MSILLRTRHHQEAERQAKTMAQAAREAPAHVPMTAAKLPGDPMALRGIPVIGRGVGGASPGTRPGA